VTGKCTIEVGPFRREIEFDSLQCLTIEVEKFKLEMLGAVKLMLPELGFRMGDNGHIVALEGGMLPKHATLREFLRSEERAYIERELHETSGNLQIVATRLGISMATLHRRLDDLRLRDWLQPKRPMGRNGDDHDGNGSQLTEVRTA
jgi:hypothetical protein